MRVFGIAPSGVECHTRSAAYVVVADTSGHIAAIRIESSVGPRLWLPGGGIESDETAEEAATREVHEELGRGIRLRGTIGHAIQYFYAADEERWYEMTATFFRAEFDGELRGAGAHELSWIRTDGHEELFFHACHAWAVRQARRR